MALAVAVDALLKSLQRDLEALRALNTRLDREKQELVDLNQSLSTLGLILNQNQDLAEKGAAGVAALCAFWTSMGKSIDAINGQATSPRNILRSCSLPQLIGSDSKFPNEIASTILRLDNITKDAQKISVGASKAIDLAHRRIPMTTACIDRLERNIKDLEADIASKQTLSHPIQSLPIEVLSHILRLAVILEHEQREEDLLDTSCPPVITNTTTLSSIRLTCRRWFRCVQGDPLLPRAMVLRASNAFPPGQPVPGLEPTTLTVIQRRVFPAVHSSWEGHLAQVNWGLRSVFLTFEADVVPYLLQQIPCVPSLSLYSRRSYSRITMPTNLKNIGSLTCVDILPIFEENFDALRDLHLEFRDPDALTIVPWETLPETLGRSPNLTTLSLSVPFPNYSNVVNLLPHLHTLSILPTFPLENLVTHFREGLKCPQLSCLNIVLPDKPDERIEGILSIEPLRHQLQVFNITGPTYSIEWASVPSLPALKTVSLEGPCSVTLLTGFLSVSQNGGQSQLNCPVLSKICIKKSSIGGSGIYDEVQAYCRHRELEGGDMLPRMSVEVYDCPNVSVAQMRELRRLRE